jgi:hypothetical protein
MVKTSSRVKLSLPVRTSRLADVVAVTSARKRTNDAHNHKNPIVSKVNPKMRMTCAAAERLGQPTAGAGCDVVRRLRVKVVDSVGKVKSPSGWLHRLVRPRGCWRMDVSVVMVLVMKF